MLPRQNTEEEMIRQGTDRTPVSWPHVNRTPLNEFHTKGYILYVYGVSNSLSYRLVVLIANTHLHDQT